MSSLRTKTMLLLAILAFSCFVAPSHQIVRVIKNKLLDRDCSGIIDERLTRIKYFLKENKETADKETLLSYKATQAFLEEVCRNDKLIEVQQEILDFNSHMKPKDPQAKPGEKLEEAPNVPDYPNVPEPSPKNNQKPKKNPSSEVEKLDTTNFPVLKDLTKKAPQFDCKDASIRSQKLQMVLASTSTIINKASSTYQELIYLQEVCLPKLTVEDCKDVKKRLRNISKVSHQKAIGPEVSKRLDKASQSLQKTCSSAFSMWMKILPKLKSIASSGNKVCTYVEKEILYKVTMALQMSRLNDNLKYFAGILVEKVANICK